MKKTLSFRILSLLFALVFLVTALPLGIFANDTETTAETAVANDGLTATESEGVSLLPTGYEDEPTFPEEISELRTENVKHFDKGDGTYEAIAYGGAVHRKDADGKWQDIDNTLTLREDRGAERYVDADARISFAPAASNGAALWQLSENGYSISLSLADADLRSGAAADVKNHASRAEQIAAAKKADDTDALFRVDNSTKILYRNVLADVDLEYILSGNDVKETIFVSDVRENYDFPFRLSLSGLIPKTTDDGAILLLDAKSGEEVYLLPAPYMTDANDDYSDAVSYRLTDLGEGEYEIIVSASDEWINAPERAFPVAIDPTVTNQNSSLWDSYTDYSTPTTNYGTSAALWVSNYWITYLQFGLPYLPNGASINTAFMYVSYYYNITDGSLTANAYQVLNSWNETQITYNNAPQIASTESASATMTASPDVTSSAPGTAIFSIANLVRNWYGAPSTNYGVAIRRASGDNMSVILKSREASAGRAYLSINYYIDAGIVDGIYQIKNAASGKYLTVTGQGTAVGTKLEQRTNSYEDHQQFLVRSIGNYEYTIQPLHATGMALSTQSANTGTNVTLASYNANDNAQIFSISKYDSNNSYVIKTKKSNFNNLFTIPLGLPTNGLKVVQLGFDGLASQRWVFEFAKPLDGVYAIKKADTNIYVKNITLNELAWVFQEPFASPPTNESDRDYMFKIAYRMATNDYVIRSMSNNEIIIYPSVYNNAPVAGRVTVSGAPATDNNLPTTRTWKMTPTSDGYDYIWYKENETTYYMRSTSNEGGGPILSFTTNPNDAGTKWSFHKYNGTPIDGVSEISFSDVLMLGETFDYDVYMYSSTIGKNGPIIYSVSEPDNSPTDKATIDSSTGVLTTLKGGMVRVKWTYSGAPRIWSSLVNISFEDRIIHTLNNKSIDKLMLPENNGSSYIILDSFDHSKTTMMWKFEYAGNGYYKIKNDVTGYYLTAPSNDTNNAKITQSAYNSTYGLWMIQRTSDGYFTLQSKNQYERTTSSPLFLTVSNNYIVQSSNTSNYKWSIDPLVMRMNVLHDASFEDTYSNYLELLKAIYSENSAGNSIASVFKDRFGIALRVTYTTETYESYPYIENCVHKTSIETICKDCKNAGSHSDAIECWEGLHHKSELSLLGTIPYSCLYNSTYTNILFTAYKCCYGFVVRNDDGSINEEQSVHQDYPYANGWTTTNHNRIIIMAYTQRDNLPNNVDGIMRTTAHETLHTFGAHHCNAANPCIMNSQNTSVTLNLTMCDTCQSIVNENKLELYKHE